MLQKILILLVLVLTTNSIYAEKQLAIIGNDTYVAGNSINVKGSDIDDLFAAAKSISIDNSITGSAYLAAKNITIKNNIGQNLYAAGQIIFLQGQILGDANLAGENVFVSNSIGSDLRVAGDNVQINDNIGGDLLVAANNLEIKGNISGSVALAVKELNFSPDARIQGSLTLYTDSKENFNIPNSVIPPNRINYKSWGEIDHEFKEHRGGGWISKIFKLLFAAVIIFAIAIFFRKKIANSYERGISNIWASLGYGFLALSALVGSIFVSGITLIGIPLSILLVAATVILWCLCYLLGNYFIICCIWQKLRGSVPNTTLNIAIVSVLSGISTVLIVSIPWLGWWLMIAIILFGLGSVVPCRCIKK